MFSVEKDIRGVDYTVPMIVNNAVDIAQEFEDVRAICRGYLGHLEDKNKKIDPEFIVFLYSLGMSDDERKEYLEDSKSYYHSFVEYMESLKRDVENKKENIELDYDMLDEFDGCIEFDDVLCNYLERELKKLLGDKLVESNMYLDFCELDYTYEMRYYVSILYYDEKNEIQDYSGTEEVYYRAY